jgi:hypothetical protein
MNIQTDKMQMIFRKDYEDRTVYTMGMSKKRPDGTYDNAYIPVNFKKGVELENQTNIYIKNAWLTFFKTREGKPIFYIFINEFNTVKEQANEFKDASIKTETNGLKSLNIEIGNDDLPF